MDSESGHQTGQGGAVAYFCCCRKQRIREPGQDRPWASVARTEPQIPSQLRFVNKSTQSEALRNCLDDWSMCVPMVPGPSTEATNQQIHLGR